MTTDNLDSLSDSALAEAVALECAGWRYVNVRHGRDPWWFASPANFAKFKPEVVHAVHPTGFCPQILGGEKTLPPFATSADAILPLLEKFGHPDWGRDAEYSRGNRWNGWRVILGDVTGEAPTFARAAAIALVRAARAKMTAP